MTIKNKLYNWFFKVKRIRSKGARNAGRKGRHMVKYDWSKPFAYLTPKYIFNEYEKWLLKEARNKKK